MLVMENKVLTIMVDAIGTALQTMICRLTAALLLAASLNIFVVPTVHAGSNLLVTPTRVVFDNRSRSAQVTLMNQGDETGNYRISFIRQNMTDNGKFVPVKEGEDGKYADQMIRYSPRQVTLDPGQSQIVRLLLRRPRNLEDGEYRSHLLFQGLPNPKTTNIEDLSNKNRKGISVEIVPIVGISIPVIVRHGELSANVSLTDVRVVTPDKQDGKPGLSVVINRTGNASVYGDFKAVFTPAGGEPTVVGQAIGVAVYATNAQRRFRIPLQVPPGFNLQNGDLHITYTRTGETPETGLLAEVKTRL